MSRASQGLKRMESVKCPLMIGFEGEEVLVATGEERATAVGVQEDGAEMRKSFRAATRLRCR